jgi:hypothetical protein
MLCWNGGSKFIYLTAAYCLKAYPMSEDAKQVSTLVNVPLFKDCMLNQWKRTACLVLLVLVYRVRYTFPKYATKEVSRITTMLSSKKKKKKKNRKKYPV